MSDEAVSVTYLPPDQLEVWLARHTEPPMRWTEITLATGKTRTAVKALYAKAAATMHEAE